MKNLAALVKLRDSFKEITPQEVLDMSIIYTKTDCGSQFCIAGRTLIINGYCPVDYDLAKHGFPFWANPEGVITGGNALDLAQKILGLNGFEARLFTNMNLQTPEDVIKELDLLIASAELEAERNSNVEA